MVNYGNGKIYKIEPIQGGDIYVGSTTKQYLSQRMDKHRSDYKRWKAGQACKVMSFDVFEKYGIENCQIILLESVNATCKEELLVREAHYIQTLECVNKCIPGRTKKQYREDHKEEIKQYRDDHNDQIKQYYVNNKGKIAEQKKQYYKDNKDKMSEQKKQYYVDKKEQIKEHQKQYYVDNKEKIAELNSIRITCECGCQITQGNLAKHRKSNKHIEWLNNNQNNILEV